MLLAAGVSTGVSWVTSPYSDPHPLLLPRQHDFGANVGDKMLAAGPLNCWSGEGCLESRSILSLRVAALIGGTHTHETQGAPFMRQDPAGVRYPSYPFADFAYYPYRRIFVFFQLPMDLFVFVRAYYSSSSVYPYGGRHTN